MKRPPASHSRGSSSQRGRWRQRKRRLSPAGLERALRKCRLRARFAELEELFKVPAFRTEINKYKDNYSDDKVETKVHLRRVFLSRIRRYTKERVLIAGYTPDGLAMMRLKQRSRWNLDGYPWRRYWRSRLRDQFTRLKRCTMITLTYDRELFRRLCPMPDWWPLSEAAWATLLCQYHLATFRRRVWDWCERNGVKYLWLGAVLELQDDGWPHFHVLWVGHRCPPPPLMFELWGWCQPQGLDVSRERGTSPELYLSKYLAKHEGEIRAAFEDRQQDLPFTEKLDSLLVLWWFRIRQFNFRPAKKMPLSVRLEVEREIQDPPVKWHFLGFWSEDGWVDLVPSAISRLELEDPELLQPFVNWSGAGPPPVLDLTPRWMDEKVFRLPRLHPARVARELRANLVTVTA